LEKDGICFFSVKLNGKVIGTGHSDRPLSEAEIEPIKRFLISLRLASKSERKGEIKMSENANLVFLAGTIKTVKVDGKRAFFLLDVGEEKWIPCSVYDDEMLLGIMERFKKEDFIQLKGFVRPWSQKKDGEWQNNIDIRVREIKNPPSAPAKKQTRSSAPSQEPTNDDIPF
jgi:hypothetical protein